MIALEGERATTPRNLLTYFILTFLHFQEGFMGISKENQKLYANTQYPSAGGG